MKTKATHDQCPSCAKKLEAQEKRYLPFCSKRCQMVDLGKWFQEEYSIPASQTLDESEQTLKETEDE